MANAGRGSGNGPRGQQTENVVVFDLGGEACALPSDFVQEIVLLPALSKPPGLPVFVAGLMNLGGAAIPVLRLHGLLGMEPVEPNLYTPVVVLRGLGTQMALMVDRVAEVLDLAKASMVPVDSMESFNGCLVADLAFQGRIIHLLDPARLLLEKEKAAVGEFRREEQIRLDRLEATAT